MRKQRCLRQVRFHRLFTWLFVLAFVIASVASAADAQSGRRTPKREKSEGVQPPAEKEPPLTQESPKAAEPVKISVLLATDSIAFSGTPMYLRVIMESCAARLKQASISSVRIAERDMNRKEASDYAKKSAEVNVAWIELGRQGMSNSVDDIEVEYILFAPGTGKTKTQGRVYLRRAGVGGIGLPVPSGSPTALEYSFKQAGREVADRILSALSLSTPPGN